MSRGLDPDIHAIFPTSCWKECDTAHELVRKNRNTPELCNSTTQFEFHYKQCHICVLGQDRIYCNVGACTYCSADGCWAGTAFQYNLNNPDPGLKAIFDESLKYCNLSQPLLDSPPFIVQLPTETALSTITYPATSTTATTSDWKTTSEDNPPTHAVDNEQIDNHQGRDNQDLGSGHLSSLQLIGIISGAGTVFVLLLAALACWKLAGYRRRASQLSKKEQALNEIESQGTQKLNGISINELDDPPAPRIEMDIEPGVCEMEVMFPRAELSERSGYEELEVIYGQDRRQENPKPARGKRRAPDKSESKFVEMSGDPVIGS
ncbi:hypothetical protein QC763_407241 [Podospora pseudopauciseta]|uniref:Uncharacterized protein n=1 Tax=Podospora pseudopauciseta TaxID=2093780 RepID=A0ABR0HDY2_9PEZI|nr:hypothetical protein QC763_407241 [Podospora pseudopauciseta]